jgi:RecB family exonuclease
MCPRSFYFKEVENIKTHSTDKKIELDLGNLIHNILRDIYQNRDHYLNADDLTKDINSELDKALKSNREDQGLKENSIPDIYIKSWKERLKRFAKNEVERFRSGVRVYAVEKNLKIENYRGFHIDGRIDRVDILPNGQLLLIDYKLSNPYKFNNFFSGKDEHDFQLLFYYILLKENEENISTENLFYYNLSTGELIKNKRKDLEELHISLEEIIELEKENIVFQKNVKCDQYCDYKILCNEK